MEEAEAVLERLGRIEALERAGAAAPELIEELRHLVREAEAWSALEGDARTELAVDRCRSALGSGVAMSR
jgi:hypothetical protein